jgi:hydrogenase-4 component B
MALVHFAFASLLASALLAWLLRRHRAWAAGVGAAGAVLGLLALFGAAVSVLGGARPADVVLPIPLPFGRLALGLDPLSAFFLIPLAGLGAIAALYGRRYWLLGDPSASPGGPFALFNLLLATMAAVLVARDWFFLVLAWEGMTLSSFLLVTLDHGEGATRQAGWIYLVAAHVGEACLLGLVLLCERATGGTGFASLAAVGTSPWPVGLALLGFGIKAGFLPFHVWLPKAHAAAPSHVSAVMSGVLVKIGLYGLLRVFTLLPVARWWGPALMVLGLAGALWGIGMALVQRDIKRVLAYSTVENMGIIALGLGLMFWRWERGDGGLATLAAFGALLHVWNHAAMKGLMFLGAGSVVHGAGTRDLERMGGLLRRMPCSGLVLIAGALALAGLPPFNGFVGEWLMYFGFLGGGLSGGGAAGVVVLLATGLFALVGGLSALAFVRLVGVSCLGEPRSPEAARAHESPAGMTYPMGALAGVVALAGVLPMVFVPALSRVLGQLLGTGALAHVAAARASLRMLGTTHLALWGALLGVGILAFRRQRSARAPVETWGCGYLAPTARMQYTARSFSELAATRLLPRFLRPAFHQVRGEGYFPTEGSLRGETVDPMVRGVLRPLFGFLADRFARLRWVQRGALHLYLLYIFVLAVAALGWIAWLSWVGA